MLLPIPKSAVPSEAERKQIQELESGSGSKGGRAAQMDTDEADDGKDSGGVGGSSRGAAGDDDLMKELRMDEYDEEESGAQIFLGGANLQVFEDNRDDPYIVAEDAGYESDEDNSVIKKTDFVLLAGLTEQEYSAAEVHVYDKTRGGIFVHHDIVLPSFPLSFAYIGGSSGDGKAAAGGGGADTETRNFAAVGTFKPEIELWDLDVVNAIEPVATLGGREAPKPVAPPKGRRRGKKKKKKALKDVLLGELKPGSHSAGVMSLAWNRHNRPCLASGSADNTVKLWDVPSQRCTMTLAHHKGKVQGLEWNPREAPVLLSGSYDKTVVMSDVRDAKRAMQFGVDGEIEDISWNSGNPAIFAASTDGGSVYCFDVRKAKAGGGGKPAPLFRLGCHDEATSAVRFNPKIAHLLGTASTDGTVKLWDLQSSPVLVDKKDLKVGKLFCMQFNEDDASVLAAGGSDGKVAIWDIMSSTRVASRYGGARTAPRRS